jgi:hypothetical protein
MEHSKLLSDELKQREQENNTTAHPTFCCLSKWRFAASEIRGKMK